MHQYNSTVIISKIFIISIIFGMKESKWKRKKNYRGLNPFSAIPTKWSNTFNNSAVKPANCLSVLHHFAVMALKGLNNSDKLS